MDDRESHSRQFGIVFQVKEEAARGVTFNVNSETQWKLESPWQLNPALEA